MSQWDVKRPVVIVGCDEPGKARSSQRKQGSEKARQESQGGSLRERLVSPMLEQPVQWEGACVFGRSRWEFGILFFNSGVPRGGIQCHPGVLPRKTSQHEPKSETIHVFDCAHTNYSQLKLKQHRQSPCLGLRNRFAASRMLIRASTLSFDGAALNFLTTDDICKQELNDLAQTGWVEFRSVMDSEVADSVAFQIVLPQMPSSPSNGGAAGQNYLTANGRSWRILNKRL